MRTTDRRFAISTSQSLRLSLVAGVLALGLAASSPGEEPSATPPRDQTEVHDKPTAARVSAIGLVEVKVKDVADLEIEQETQARLLVHRLLLMRVLETSDPIRQSQWFSQFVSTRDGQQRVDVSAAVADLVEHFRVAVIPKSRLLEVRMSAVVPKDCQTIIREIVDQHIKDQRELVNLGQIERAQALEQLKLNYESQIRDTASRMLRIATDLGSVGVGVGPGPSSKDLELQQLISEQLKAASAQGAAESSVKRFDDQMQTNSAPELQLAVQRDPTCLEYRRRMLDVEETLDDLQASLGAKDAKTIAAKARLDKMKARLDDAQNEVRANTAELTRGNLLNADLDATATRKRIDERINEVRTELSSLAKMNNEYQHLQSDLTALRAKLDKLKDEQDRLGYIEGTGKASPVDWASLPDLPDPAR